jgi:hypothetical protein
MLETMENGSSLENVEGDYDSDDECASDCIRDGNKGSRRSGLDLDRWEPTTASGSQSTGPQQHPL